MTTKYQMTGTLTEHLPVDRIGDAADYLVQDDMTRWVDASVEPVIDHVEWRLHGDGYNWTVTVIASRDLKAGEIRVMEEWISGQNSDGLGENFEQRDFAELFDTDYYGSPIEDTYRMVSFDWQTNPHKLIKL